MKRILTILFFLPLFVFSQQRITGNPTFMRNVAPATGGGEEGAFYEVIEANPTAVDTAMDGIGALSWGRRLAVVGGWNASYGLPNTRNSIYNFDLLDYSNIDKTHAEWTPRHSMGYGTGGTGYGYVVGSDQAPEQTSTSRLESWRTTTDTSFRHWTQRSLGPWSDSLVLAYFTIVPDSISGNDTLYFGGGQRTVNAPILKSSKMWRSTDAGSNWSVVADNARFFGGNNAGAMCWFPNMRRFVIIKGSVYDNDAGGRIYGDSVFLVTQDLSTYTFIGKIHGVQYVQTRVWDNKVWIVGGNDASGNTSRIYTVSANGVLTEQIITLLIPLHATSLAVDQYNDRLIIACGNLERRIWYIRRQAL